MTATMAGAELAFRSHLLLFPEPSPSLFPGAPWSPDFTVCSARFQQTF